tara:strand:- start:225 stop:806 length:582 start_codon:yes stop_codon:yes gene_type:complete
MRYKTLFQVFLIFLALSISSIFYFKYFHKKNTSKIINVGEKKIDKDDITLGNTVKDILYESIDSEGNNYVINSDFGTFSDRNQEEILMTNVTAKIIFKNGNQVDLKSNRAKYNTVNSNTNFFDNVYLKFLNHSINSDNIDVLFTDSKLEAYNNLVYRNSDVNLMADKIELDLLTKNSKIFMFDNSKVKIIKEQ